MAPNRSACKKTTACKLHSLSKLPVGVSPSKSFLKKSNNYYKEKYMAALEREVDLQSKVRDLENKLFEETVARNMEKKVLDERLFLANSKADSYREENKNLRDKNWRMSTTIASFKAAGDVIFTQFADMMRYYTYTATAAEAAQKPSFLGSRSWMQYFQESRAAFFKLSELMTSESDDE